MGRQPPVQAIWPLVYVGRANNTGRHLTEPGWPALKRRLSGEGRGQPGCSVSTLGIDRRCWAMDSSSPHRHHRPPRYDAGGGLRRVAGTIGAVRRYAQHGSNQLSTTTRGSGTAPTGFRFSQRTSRVVAMRCAWPTTRSPPRRVCTAGSKGSVLVRRGRHVAVRRKLTGHRSSSAGQPRASTRRV